MARRVAVNSLVAVAAVVSLSAKAVLGHPLCYLDDSNPSLEISATFCSNEEPDGFCCTADVESQLQSTLVASGASDDCADLYKEVLCGLCHPYSAHLYERLNVADGLTMTIEFCDTFYSACSAQLGLEDNYCEVHTGGSETDQYWSYPLVIDNSFDDSGLIKAFPSLPDDDLPAQPMDMHMTPDGSKWWIAGLEGQIVEVDAIDPGISTVVLDISDRIIVSYEEGLLGFALSPSFMETGAFYLCYTAAGDAFPVNRLSRFTYDSSSASGTADSEEILITTSEKQSSVHSAGWVGFAPSSYADSSAGSSHDLYWSVGDGGPQNDPFGRAQDANEFHGSMMRISVSADADGYAIPSDNPFAGGGGLGEICAWGMRNPYRCSFDKDTDDLYCGDVGHLSLESVNKIECGKNYGWRRFEGERCSDQIETEFPEACDSVDRTPYTFPEFNYCHPSYVPSDYEDYLVDQNICGDRSILGSAIIGGYVYRGAKYADLLGGNYIFADHTLQVLYHLYPNGDGSWGYGVLLGDDTVPKIASFAEDNEGELYFIGYLGTIYELPCGNLCDGEGVNPVTDEPAETPATLAPVTPADPDTDNSDLPTPAPMETPAPTETPEPTPPRTASPDSDRFGSDYTIAPVRTETVPPAATMSPAAPVEQPPTTTTPGEPSDPTDGGDDGGGDGADGDRVPDLCSPVDDGEVPLQDAVPEVSPQYLGCYKDSKDDKSTRILQLAYQDNESMTPVVCETFCRDNGADLFGLQYGSQCLCGNSKDADLDKHDEKAVCNMPCAGDSSASCGGYLAADVYNIGGGQQVPENSEYLGCMRDEKHSYDARALFEGLLKCYDNMTTQICERFCRKKGAVVYGLQYGHECFCGDELDHDQYGPGVCDLRCTGDPHTTCGGYLAQNVYALHY